MVMASVVYNAFVISLFQGKTRAKAGDAKITDLRDLGPKQRDCRTRRMANV